MNNRHLHIVCLDVPYPVNYGGLFDLFYKIRSLHQVGVHIYLHCFEYGRGRQPELEHYCNEVHYYPRRTGLKGFSTNIPYIVSSRQSEALANRLLQDNHPILLEGIHCTALLLDDRFAQRKMVVRLHNVEHEYYQQLGRMETSPLKKLYYQHESRLLKKYEAAIAGKASFLAVTARDAEAYRHLFDAQAEYLPVFVAWDKVESETGTGQFCLYHGNLSVTENEKAVTWLLEEVFSKLQIPFVIAGKNPSRRLEQLAHRWQHSCIVANPSVTEMQDLIKKAHINVLPSFNMAGIKLKLLNSLFVGRHCVVNAEAVEGTGLEDCCAISYSADDMRSHIASLMQEPFRQEHITHRTEMLADIYNNQKNSRKLTGMIW
jgi:hypothetical protein